MKLRSIRRSAALLLGGMLLTACKGPVAPLEVGTQTVQIALVLGEREAIVSAPAPISLPPATPISLPPVIVRIARPAPPQPPPPPVPAPVPPREACPQFSPIDPVIAADLTVTGRPAEAEYPYRTVLSGALGAEELSFNETTIWKIGNVVDNVDGSFSYDADVTFGDESLGLTTWRIQRGGTSVATSGNPLGLLPATPPEVVAPVEPGLYLEATTTYAGTVFTPASPIPFVQFPIAGGETFRASGTDGVSTLDITSTVGDRVKVNACGVPVQAWQIDVVGTFATAASNGTAPVVVVTRTLYFAPQFGGLVVSDSQTTAASAAPGFPADNFSQSHTISQQPQPAKVDD